VCPLGTLSWPAHVELGELLPGHFVAFHEHSVYWMWMWMYTYHRGQKARETNLSILSLLESYQRPQNPSWRTKLEE
jgi:hypothetical protein